MNEKTLRKNALLKECVKILQTPKVSRWYSSVLEKTSQAETITKLEVAIEMRNLTPREALAITLVTGVQWNEKFEDTP